VGIGFDHLSKVIRRTRERKLQFRRKGAGFIRVV